jgi:hypothetical protein
LEGAKKEDAARQQHGLELKNLIVALKNDSASYSISSVWNPDADVQNAAKLAHEKEDAEARQKSEAQTQRESEEKLARTVDAAERATKQKRQEALQSQFGKIAAATSAAIAKDIRDSTDSRADWQQGPAYTEFPKFVTWYQNMVRNRWELQSFNSEIADYGQAEWKGRMMEMVFTKITMRLRNRILGEYRDLCAIFGRMNDSEFHMVREPEEFGCEEKSRLSSWKKSKNFKSQWLVQAQM